MSQKGKMGLLRPVLRTNGTLIRSLFGIFRQFLSETQCIESTSPLKRVFVLSVSKSWIRVCFEALTSSLFALIVKEKPTRWGKREEGEY